MVYQAVENATTLWDVIAPQLPQKAETPLRFIARALGLKVAGVESLLKSPISAETLLNLNRMAQQRHLAVANRVWPHCTWFDWRVERQGLHPVLDLITRVFGRDLLDYVAKTYGDQVVRDYWSELAIPDGYDDLALDPDADDPFEGLPDEQFVFNPHIPDDEDGEFFVFDSIAAADCFRWLIANRYNYTHYVENWTGYCNDPLGIHLAYDLRVALRDPYWAPLPPDTLPSYLAIARALQGAVVPDVFHEGRLPELSIRKVATLQTDL